MLPNSLPQFFGITDAQSCWLFDPGYYRDPGSDFSSKGVTPDRVARRIDALLAGTADIWNEEF